MKEQKTADFIKERYPFYDEDLATRDVELNGEQVQELMQSYSDQQNAELRETLEACRKAITSEKEIIEIRTKKLNAALERVKELEGLMQEFVDRVDRGEVRSKRTYAKFKEALKK